MQNPDKKTQILMVAERLFAQKGFDGTSVRDISEAANVNVSMISYYFGSKDKLMEVLFEERTNHILPKLEALVKDKSIDPFQKINVMIEDYINRAVERILFHKIIIGEQMMEKNSIFSEMVTEMKKKNTAALSEIIQEGQSAGLFKKDVDIVLLMNTMVGIVTQSFINQPYYRSFHHLESLPQAEFEEMLKQKLTTYIKELFKNILSYEAK